MLKGEVPETDYIVPIGEANVVREGDDITVITYGLAVQFVDQEAIIEATKKTGKVLLVTEDNKQGSIISEVAAII
ncbi:2-oxoisovalerate dehydrogenase subunit beta [Listeria monocytogenes N53-1]|nr:2-oxoisovalerate dehydrogenase subunit beta [Listeria monocytogenes N53-1]